MPFFLALNKDDRAAVEALLAENNGVHWQEQGLFFEGDSLHAVAEAVALLAPSYSGGHLPQVCLKCWAEKNGRRFLPPQAKARLIDEFRRHSKESSKYIYLDLRHIVCGQRQVNMYGFIHFAAHNLRRYYQSLANHYLDSYRRKREEQAFVEALQLVVRSQEPQIEQVWVQIKADGDFAVHDPNGYDLKGAYLREQDLSETDEVGREDLLLSILLNFVPRQLQLNYGGQGHKRMRLLEAVFSDRIEIVM